MARQQVIDKERKRGDYTLFLDKLVWVIVFIALQISTLVYINIRLREQYFLFEGIMTLLSLVVVLYIINEPINPAYKLAWCISILLAPIFGGAFYLLLSVNRTRRMFRKEIRKSVLESKTYLTQSPELFDEITTNDKHALPHAKYIYNEANYPVYSNKEAKYLASGEEYFEVLMQELAKATQFIFLEFFIIQEGLFWNSVLDVLKQKVKEGVEVKIIYDDMGCLRTLPSDYSTELQSYGIQCHSFNPVSPTLSLRQNNRDHRKIIVIDGEVSFTGGINLADEYINNRNKINGHWKDNGIMLRGSCANNFTIMFLQFWQYLSKEEINYSQYLNTSSVTGADGFVQPYADNPLFTEIIAEHVYLNMIHRATKYIYITTPYLIIDNEMLTALSLAASSGIDVRIITPHIPDKKTVFMITRSFYEPLTKAGVKIYEYTPGFIHSKMMIVDDEYCAIGSINLDFRSLYLHFECATMLYFSSVIEDAKKDFLITIERSEEMSYEKCIATNKPYRFWLSLLRLYAPLL